MNPMDSGSSSVSPLEDLLVVDLTQVASGPFATMLLGDLGADVVKLEEVNRGDRAREFEPRPEYFDTLNRNKQSIAVDLKEEEGQQVARDLLREADVFVENTKPDRLETYNLSYDQISKFNPQLIHCSISGFGSPSPYENIPAWDMLIQAMSGIMGLTGEEDGPPIWSGLPSGDLIAAMYAVVSIVTALYARERGAINSEYIEIPMFDSAVSWLTARAGHTFGTGEPFPRSGTRHPIAEPFGQFECLDGHIVVAAGTDSLWDDFCTAIDREDIRNDNRFSSMEKRVQNRGDLLDELGPVFEERSTDAWLKQLHYHDVPAGPIHDTKTVWADPHVKQRNLRRSMDRDNGNSADVIANPIYYDSLVTRMAHAPPMLGEHTEEVLNEIGYSREKIKRLQESNIVRGEQHVN